MKTNLLAQNDNLVIENLKADVGKSVMDLSHSVTFPIDVDGAILPICCIETLPSDSFEISCELLLRQLSPLKVPVMTNLRLNTAFYYCDNRMAWKKWDRFMTGGRSGNEVYDIPRVSNCYFTDDGGKHLLFDKRTAPVANPAFNNINYKTTLHTYFGISMNEIYSDSAEYYNEADDLPVAFPFFGYQMICRDFYTNADRLPQYPAADTTRTDFDNLTSDWSYESLFPSDDDEIRLVDGPQFFSGFNTGDDPYNVNHGFLLDKVRYHDVRPDYFTSSKKAPMRGDAPTLSAVQSSITLPSGTSIRIDDDNLISITEKTVHTADSVGLSKSMVVVPDGQLGINMPAIGDTTSSTKPLTTDSQKITSISGKTNGDITLTGTLSTNYTAADIRLLSQLTVWQELNMLHEPYYNDFLNAHFDNVRVGESPIEKPQYIGGTSQLISINEILQTSQSTESSPLGNQGATAMSLANNYVGKYYSNNYGYIIGVAYIIPDMLYPPAMPRGFSRRTKEDYYSPEFANLSMQATLNKELFFSHNWNWNNTPWGYTGAFDELRSIPNRIAGDLLNSDYSDIQKWVLTRSFDEGNLPSMSTSWLSLKNNVDKTAWSVPTMPAFMLQCANYIKAVRPMPKVAIPKAL